MANGSCPTCGRALDEHDRHLRFTVPEPVLGIPEAERPARTWGNDVLMQVQDIGAFVRILVPVNLAGSYKITYGAWLSVSPDDLRRAWEVWTLDVDQIPYAVDSQDPFMRRVLDDVWPHEAVLKAIAPYERRFQ